MPAPTSAAALVCSRSVPIWDVVLDLRSLRNGVSTGRAGGAKDKGSSFANRALMLRSNSAHRSFPYGSEMVVRQGPGRPDDAAKFIPLHRQNCRAGKIASDVVPRGQDARETLRARKGR